MHISFHPPVDQTVPISVLPHASTVQLHFTATLNSQKAYDEFKRDGVRIQVWSDIPAGGREEGEWGELSFEEGIPYKEDNSLSETVSLLSEDTDRGSKGHTLCLDCTVPLFGQSRFAYTYRLVYPDGDIRWLGQFGRNGTLILEYADLRITLGDGWRLEDEAARDYRWCNDGVPVDVEVARLDRKDYSVWCVGKESSISDTTSDSSIIFIVPRVADSVAVPQTFVLSASASHGSSIAITPLGSIRFASPAKGSLLLRTYNSNLDLQTFMDTIIDHSGISPLRLIDCAVGHVVLTSPENIYPISVAVIPFSPRPSSKLEVRLSLQRLATVFSSAFHICIAPRINNGFYFFPVPSVGVSDETIAFTLDATGGQFLLAPAHCLAGESGTWHISVLTPHAPAAPPAEAVNRLPTPPSSPKLGPVTQRETSSMVPSLLDLNGEINAEREMTTPSTETAPTRPSATAQARSTVTRREAGNSSILCMRYVFAVVAVFLRSLFAVAVRFCHNNRRVDEQTPLLVEDTAERSSGVHASDISRYHSYAYVEPNTEPDVPPPSGDVQVHDAEPNSSRYSFAAQSNGFRVDVESSGVPEVLVQVAEPSEYESSPEDSPSETELKPSPTPLFVDIHGGTVSVILRALYANASVDEVSIELDGTTVDRIVEKLNDGIYSLKFSAGVHGGKIKIFAGLV